MNVGIWTYFTWVLNLVNLLNYIIYMFVLYLLYVPIQVPKFFKKFQGNFCIVISAVSGALAFSSHKLIIFFSPKTFFL